LSTLIPPICFVRCDRLNFMRNRFLIIFLLITAIIFLQFILLLFYFGPISREGKTSFDNSTTLSSISEGKKYRIAILIPFLGSHLPSWFDGFASSLRHSRKSVDWFIFISESSKRDVPENVKLIQLSSQDFYRRIARIGSGDIENITGFSSASAIEMLLERSMYLLVEFKPCLATIFSVNILAHYTSVSSRLFRRNSSLTTLIGATQTWTQYSEG